MACRRIREESCYCKQVVHYVSQPDLYTLDKIATLRDIDKREFITGKD